MKSFKDYLAESEYQSSNPVAGDIFELNLKEDTLVESYVVESNEHGVVLASDQRMLDILESFGYEIEDVCECCGESVCECTEGVSTDYQLPMEDGTGGQMFGNTLEENDDEPLPMERACLHRIMMQHPTLLATYGPERVMDAVRDECEWIGDVEEIGSSDVSAAVQSIIRNLEADQEATWKLQHGEKELEEDREEDQYVVVYTDVNGRYKNSSKVFNTLADAKKHADYGNNIDKVGGKYTVKSVSQLEEGSGGDVMWKELDRVTRLERLRDHAKRQGDTETFEKLDKEIKDIYSRPTTEAKYRGREVPLNKPMRGDVAKSKVYVKDPKTGNIKKVNFGDKNMRIKKSNPARRKSFRARHNCANPGPKTSARYWSCRAW
jgi:hypothetical protein